MNWFMARLGEHSTQVAIGAAVAAIGAGLQGQLPWSAAVPVIVGSVVTAVIPATPPKT